MEQVGQGDWKEAVAEIWRLFKETDARLDKLFRETDEQFKETAARFRETDARLDALFKETDKKINKLNGLFSNQWGSLVESLVEPRALKLFQERGIKVRQVFQRVKVKVDGQDRMELDLLLANENEVVVIEVKSTLRAEHVNELLEKVKKFTTYFPQYAEYKVYGGVAGLKIEEGVERYAYRKGLFVLLAMGEGLAEIKNDKGFKPVNYGKGYVSR